MVVANGGDTNANAKKKTGGSGASGASGGQVKTHTARVGIIVPPPDVRAVIDKTAAFVRANGLEFEERIVSSQRSGHASGTGEKKFSFLRRDDPYRAYYESKRDMTHDEKDDQDENVDEKKSDEGNEDAVCPPASARHHLQSKSSEKQVDEDKTSAGAKTSALVLVRRAEDGSVGGISLPSSSAPKLLAPEEEHFSVESLFEGVRRQKADVVKLTALTAALIGPGPAQQRFLDTLRSDEKTNTSMDFLFDAAVAGKPLDGPRHRSDSSQLAKAFVKLRDAYSKVIDMAKAESTSSSALRARIDADCGSRAPILARCYHRVEWERKEEAKRKKAAEANEKERAEMNAIDWHSFVLVDTIDFSAEDVAGEKVLSMLPEPMPREVVLAGGKAAAEDEYDEDDDFVDGELAVPGQTGGAALGGSVEMTEEERRMIAEGEEAARAHAMPEPAMKIVKDWKRPEERMRDANAGGVTVAGDGSRDPAPGATKPAPGVATSAAHEYVISPITGERVPVSQMDEHMRISLIDPRWKSQREAMFAKMRETTKADDDEIAKNVVLLARTRPDIFGSADEEMRKQKKSNADTAPGLSDEASRLLSTRINAMRSERGGSGSGSAAAAAAPDAMGADNDDDDDAEELPSVAELQRRQNPRGNVVVVKEPQRPEGAEVGVASIPPPPLPAAPAAVPPPPAATLPPPPPPPSSISAATLPPPPSLTAAVLPPPPAPLPPPVPEEEDMPAPPPPPPAPVDDDGVDPPAPAAKRQRVAADVSGNDAAAPQQDQKNGDDGDALMTDAAFLELHPGSVTLKIEVPQAPDTGKTKPLKMHEKLKGQTLELEIGSAAEKVSALKKRITQELGLPATKQQLSTPDLGFLKDAITLAQYNLGMGAVLTLSLRERGGKKK